MIIVGVAFILMLGIRGIESLTAKSPMPTLAPGETGIISITSAELFDVYDKDAAAADAKYRGRTLEVTGEVTLSRGIFGSYYVILSCGGNPDLFQRGIRCVFGGEIDPKVYEVEKHRVVTIQGVCQGLETEVILEQCRLIR